MYNNFIKQLFFNSVTSVYEVIIIKIIFFKNIKKVFRILYNVFNTACIYKYVCVYKIVYWKELVTDIATVF